MKKDYLIVHKSILPDYYYAVIEARDLIASGKYNVIDSCKQVGISRGTYYKYKDYIFSPSQSFGKRAILAFRLDDEKGVLSNLLNKIATYNGNIIAINQEMPINNRAYVIITTDLIDLEMSIGEFEEELKKLAGVVSIELIAVE